MLRLLVGAIAALLLAGSANAQSVPVCFKTSSSQIGCTPVTTTTSPLPVTGTFTPSASSPEFTPVTPATATATAGVLLGGQYDSTQKTLTNGQQAAVSVSPRGAVYVAAGAEALTVQPGNTANTTPWLTAKFSQYPINATTTSPDPLTGNAAGTTGAVVGTLAAAASKTTHICGFAVSATGGVATVGPITVAGLIGSSMVFQLFSTVTGANLVIPFNPCIPASAANTAITITTTADGTATAVNVNSWGYRL